MISPATPISPARRGRQCARRDRHDAAARRPRPRWRCGFFAAIDRGRNALAFRVYNASSAATTGADRRRHGDRQARLARPKTPRTLIREAGIFHIITISGVQMTLVAGIFFVGLRRLLALSPTLALHYPIKKWAAGARDARRRRLRHRHRLARRHRTRADHDA